MNRAKSDLLRIIVFIVALVIVALFAARSWGAEGDLSLAFRLALDRQQQPEPIKPPQDQHAYRWEAFADNDPAQVKLMDGDRQAGTYTFKDGKYWPIVNGQVADVPSEPPIKPPVQRGAKVETSPLSAADCVGET